MSVIEKSFSSVQETEEWLKSLHLSDIQQITVRVTADEETIQTTGKSRVKFSETELCGLWEDRTDLDVEQYVREMRKPRYPDVR